MKIVKGDTVKIIAGDDKGKTGKVLKVYPESGRVVVEKVNMVKRHMKPTQRIPQGGIVEKEAPLSVSNVMVLDPKTNQPSRVGIKLLTDGKRERVAKKSGEIIPRPE